MAPEVAGAVDIRNTPCELLRGWNRGQERSAAYRVLSSHTRPDLRGSLTFRTVGVFRKAVGRPVWCPCGPVERRESGRQPDAGTACRAHLGLRYEPEGASRRMR